MGRLFVLLKVINSYKQHPVNFTLIESDDFIDA